MLFSTFWGSQFVDNVRKLIFDFENNIITHPFFILYDYVDQDFCCYIKIIIYVEEICASDLNLRLNSIRNYVYVGTTLFI